MCAAASSPAGSRTGAASPSSRALAALGRPSAAVLAFVHHIDLTVRSDLATMRISGIQADAAKWAARKPLAATG
ncbi:hypothetical protein GCM10010349_18340 [Streptomyces flavofungini]|nr:hypothetical protein GCM10010349_18340 [Streptomyces flavofungini]